MTLNTAGLDIFLAGLDETIDLGVDDIADEVLKIREPLVPVDEGDLRDSGHKEGEPGTLKRRVVEGTDLPDARAEYTEYGTDIMDPQPHMTPAATQTDAAGIMARRIRALAARSRI